MGNYKKCTKCEEEKPATPEHFYKKRNGGFAPRCKVCVKLYYKANKERFKAYYKTNKRVILEREKSYYEANKERKKAYYKANKEAVLEKRKVYYRTPRGKYVSIKKRANEKGIHFSLPLELYEGKLWGKPCHYCGCDIEVTGLDRKDNNKGYIPDNVVPCCFDCNTKKGIKPYERFIKENQINP